MPDPVVSDVVPGLNKIDRTNALAHRLRHRFADMREPVIRRLLAALIALLGGIVVFGWLIGAAPVVRLVPDFAAMTFATALCFLLTGAALLAPDVAPVAGRAIRTRIGYAVVALAAAMVAERECRSRH